MPNNLPELIYPPVLESSALEMNDLDLYAQMRQREGGKEREDNSFSGKTKPSKK